LSLGGKRSGANLSIKRAALTPSDQSASVDAQMMYANSAQEFGAPASLLRKMRVL
jgi:hypothetical protein